MIIRQSWLKYFSILFLQGQIFLMGKKLLSN